MCLCVDSILSSYENFKDKISLSFEIILRIYLTCDVLSSSAVKAPKESKIATERDLGQEEVDEKAAELFSSDILNGLSDNVWKNRLAAVEDFEQVIQFTSKYLLISSITI